MAKVSKKAVEEVAAEPVKAPEEAAPVKKAPGRKPAAKKAEAPKAAAPKAPAKSAVEEEIIIQFAGGQWNLDDLREKAIAEFVAEGHTRGRVKKLALYVKPEEHMAYYVINDKVAGGVDFD